MATVRDLLAHKGREVVSVAPSANVLDAARLMNERSLGSLVVLEGGELAGIVTERDILRKVVALGQAPVGTTVRSVMSSPVVTCVPETSLEECAALMTTRRIRHLPVADASGLQGMISIGDVLAFQVRDQESTIQYLNSYMFDVR
jgi:CBS domain-containing protein